MTVTAEIQITDRAQSHIMEQLKKSGSSSLRLGVKESGCNGFMYTLDYLNDTSVSDFSLFERSDITVCAHEQDLPYVSGTEIAFVTEGLTSALTTACALSYSALNLSVINGSSLQVSSTLNRLKTPNS